MTQSNQQPYLMFLYSGLFVASYFGLLQIGEVTSGSHPIRAKDVHVGINKNKILFVLHSSKTHEVGDPPQLVKITGMVTSSAICLFTILHKYINLRPPYATDNEPFFIFSDRTPVKQHQMRFMLKSCLRNTGFDPDLYTVHSLRSG